MNIRSNYTGLYAGFAQKITIPNSAPKVNNEEVLKVAQETRADFYKGAFETIRALDARTKQRK